MTLCSADGNMSTISFFKVILIKNVMVYGILTSHERVRIISCKTLKDMFNLHLRLSNLNLTMT